MTMFWLCHTNLEKWCFSFYIFSFLYFFQQKNTIYWNTISICFSCSHIMILLIFFHTLKATHIHIYWSNLLVLPYYFSLITNQTKTFVVLALPQGYYIVLKSYKQKWSLGLFFLFLVKLSKKKPFILKSIDVLNAVKSCSVIIWSKFTCYLVWCSTFLFNQIVLESYAKQSYISFFFLWLPTMAVSTEMINK